MLTEVRKLLDLLSRRNKVRLTILLVMLVLLASLEMAGIASILPFMAVVADPTVIHTNKWLSAAYQWMGSDNEKSFLVYVGLLVLALLVVNNVGKALSVWLTLRYQYGLGYTLARRLLANYMSRPYAFFLGRNTAELGHVMLNETFAVSQRVLKPMLDIVSAALVALAILVLLFIVDPIVASLIVLVIGGSYATVYLLVHRKLATSGLEQVYTGMQKYKLAGEALSGIKDLKILARELTYLERFSLFALRNAKNDIFAGVISQVPRYALEVISFGGILLVVLYLLGREGRADDIVPLLALYAFAGYRLLPTLNNLFVGIMAIRYNLSSLDVVHAEFTQGVKDLQSCEAQLIAQSRAKAMTFSKSLELRNVLFQYEGSGQPALNGLTVTIERNSVVGLVGPTGCGKTTTVDLILGLLAPTRGSILVDGVEISDGNRAGWQKLVGYVPQQIYISDDTVASNIAFGIPPEEIDMAAVRRAAAIANLDEFIETSLANRYETEIGERGVRLSGGQRQRIGIARAMYRDPAILVMDEATSALDGITEDYVMDAIHNLSKDKTIILIAHRLSTVKDCDVIYQLDRGAIVGSGTYDELMRDSKWFRAAAKEGTSV